MIPEIRSLSRRGFLGALAASAALPRIAFAAGAPVEPILSRAGLADVSGFCVVDLGSGAVLDAHRAERGAPPASVLKVMTTLYALDALGPDYRFQTRLLADRPVTDGVLHGDLALVGDGDPVLDTNSLRDMARDLRAKGVREVTGRFIVVANALPGIETLNPGQPRHAGYNPAVSGLNLDFNRVRAEWTGQGADAGLRFNAPGRDFKVGVSGVIGELGGRTPPRHRVEGVREIWSLDGSKLKQPGGVWLPVRRPAEYAAEVFRAVAALEDVSLPSPETGEIPADAEALVLHESPPLTVILRGMLRYSTNLTAEVVGLRASQALAGRPETLAASAEAMTAWARDVYGISSARFVDHSGLSDVSRWSPEETVTVLAAERDALTELMREIPIAKSGDAPARRGVHARAKSGTLYFASGLAGYVEGPGGALAFAIYSADAAKRTTIDPEADGAPSGARAWGRRARMMQQDLIRRWVAADLPAPVMRPRPRQG